MDSDQIFIPRPDIREQFDRVLTRCTEEGLQVIWLQGDSGQGKTYFLVITSYSIHYTKLYEFVSRPALAEAFFMQHVSVYAGLVFFGLLYEPVSTILSLGMNILSRRP